MGIGVAVAGAVDAISAAFAGFGASIAGGIGLAGTTLGGIATGDIIGGGLLGATVGGLGGGVIDAITGKPILPGLLEGAGAGALTGGLTAGVGGGLAGEAGSALGIGATGGDILAGAGVGALGSAVTGGNPLTGAAIGGALQAGSAAISGAGGATDSAGTAAGGPGASAGATAAPASVGADLPLEGPTASGATLDTVQGLQGPTLSGQTLGATLGSASPDVSTPAATAALNGATSGVDVPVGSDLAPQDAAALQGQVALAQPAPGAASQTGLSLFGNGDEGADTPATGAGAGYTTQDVNTFPVPPQPPLLDATGNIVTDATGNTEYATPGEATYAANYDTAAQANFANPTVTDAALNGTAAAPPGNSIANLISNPTLGNLGHALGSNATLLLGGAALGYDAIMGNQQPKGEAQIESTAGQLSAQSQQLENYLTSGTLPPGVQTSLNQAAQQATATIRSQYAARGMSGSSAEAADLANVQNTIVSQGANIAMQLLQTGVSEANLASQLYGTIMNQSIQSDQQLGNALSTLATLSATASRPNIVLTGATAA